MSDAVSGVLHAATLGAEVAVGIAAFFGALFVCTRVLFFLMSVL